MQPSTVQFLKSIAPNLLRGEVSNSSPLVQQRAIAILEILKDYEWHTSKAIADQLGISRRYVQDILRAVQPSWGLISSTSYKQGWRLRPLVPNQKNQDNGN